MHVGKLRLGPPKDQIAAVHGLSTKVVFHPGALLLNVTAQL